MAKVSLSDLFGRNPQVLLLEALSENVGEEVTVPFLTELTALSKATCYSYMRQMTHDGVVIPTDRVAGVQFYTLNLKDPKWRLVAALHSHLLGEYLEDELTRSSTGTQDKVPINKISRSGPKPSVG